jgi:hypothetical protein
LSGWSVTQPDWKTFVMRFLFLDTPATLTIKKQHSLASSHSIPGVTLFPSKSVEWERREWTLNQSLTLFDVRFGWELSVPHPHISHPPLEQQSLQWINSVYIFFAALPPSLPLVSCTPIQSKAQTNTTLLLRREYHPLLHLTFNIWIIANFHPI